MCNHDPLIRASLSVRIERNLATALRARAHATLDHPQALNGDGQGRQVARFGLAALGSLTVSQALLLGGWNFGPGEGSAVSHWESPAL
jgi:hypothetical protein